MERYTLHWHPDAGADLLRLAADPDLSLACGELYTVVKHTIPPDGVGGWDRLAARDGLTGLRFWPRALSQSQLVVLVLERDPDVYVLAFGRHGDDEQFNALIECAVRRAREL